MTEEKPKAETVETGEVQSAPVKRKRKKFKKWIIVAVILVVLAVLLVRCVSKFDTGAIADALYTTEETALRTITKSLSGSGTLKPANSYTVVTLVEGEVLSAAFEEGDMVEKDTVLYEVDSSDVSKNIERSQISLEQARRSYEDMTDRQYVKAGTAGIVYSLEVKVGDKVSQGQTVATVRDSAVMTLKVPFPADDAVGFSVGQSAVVTLDGTFETLTGTVSEISGADMVGVGNTITRNVTIEVSNPGGLSNTQKATASVNGLGSAGSGTFAYRSQSTAAAMANGTVTAIHVPEGGAIAKDQILLTLGGDTLEDQLQSAAESLRNAELSMESTQDQLDNYTVQSPIRGTIVDKQYKTGDTVGAGKPLCTIYDLSYLEMTLNIDELDISDLAVGQSVRITADAVEGKEYEGVVTKVSVAGTTAGGITSYPVTIRLEETDGLLPGMNVDAEIIIDRIEDVLSIPNGAVERGGLVLITAASPSAVNAVERTSPEGYVYVRVETGVSDDDYVQIISGLQTGDTVAYIPASAASGYAALFGAMGMGGMGGEVVVGGMPGGGGPMG